jgi:hypothetical protein
VRHIERIALRIWDNTTLIPYGRRIGLSVLYENEDIGLHTPSTKLNAPSCLIPRGWHVEDWNLALARNLSENKAGLPHCTFEPGFKRKLRTIRDSRRLSSVKHPSAFGVKVRR